MVFEVPNLKEQEYKGKSLDVILYSNESSAQEQIGYSIKPDGEPLFGVEEGEWQEGWYVIGRESQCGDPIFIDLNEADSPVYTAMHGSGSWNKQIIASTYSEFIAILENQTSAKHPSSIWDFFFS